MPMFNNDKEIWGVENTDTEAPAEERIKDLRKKLEDHVAAADLPPHVYPELGANADRSVLTMKLYEKRLPGDHEKLL